MNQLGDPTRPIKRAASIAAGLLKKMTAKNGNSPTTIAAIETSSNGFLPANGDEITPVESLANSPATRGAAQPITVDITVAPADSNAVAAIDQGAEADSSRETMNGKPVLYRDNAKTVLSLNSEGFEEKLLCDGLTLNLGDACAYSCQFCYVESAMLKLDKKLIDAKNRADGRTEEARNLLTFRDVVIRRKEANELLRKQLIRENNQRIFDDPADKRIVYTSTLVDIAANMELLRETAEACNLILDNTGWEIRLLSKSSLLHLLVKNNLIPKKHHQRLIFGFSTGTLDDEVAKVIETGTSLVSKRLESLHWLQDNGFRTYGMICPSLPQDDYAKFSKDMCEAIRVDKCEHVWAEVINVRGDSMGRTVSALRAANFHNLADLVAAVGNSNTAAWDEYARATFEAHTANVPPEKLRFLQYANPKTLDWWERQTPRGAILLGSHKPEPSLSTEDANLLALWEKQVSDAVSASILACKALSQIKHYKDGVLWKSKFGTFEDYCREKWGYQKSHAYRLTMGGEFMEELEKYRHEHPADEGMITLPVNEAQIRAMADVPVENRVTVWVDKFGDKPANQLTAQFISKNIKEYVRPKERRPRVTAPVIQQAPSAPEEALERLEASADTHPKINEIKTLTAQIRALLKENSATPVATEVVPD